MSSCATVVLTRINVEKLSEEDVKNILQSIYRFCSEILIRWQSGSTIQKCFVEILSGYKEFVLLPEVLAKVPETGLLVEQVKPGGNGTTNDGNTARCFLTIITGINENVLMCSYFTSFVMWFPNKYSSSPHIHIRKSKIIRPRLFLVSMPASVPKILSDESEIISTAILLIGQLSEEAQRVPA